MAVTGLIFVVRNNKERKKSFGTAGFGGFRACRSGQNERGARRRKKRPAPGGPCGKIPIRATEESTVAGPGPVEKVRNRAWPGAQTATNRRVNVPF